MTSTLPGQPHFSKHGPRMRENIVYEYIGVHELVRNPAVSYGAAAAAANTRGLAYVKIRTRAYEFSVLCRFRRQVVPPARSESVVATQDGARYASCAPHARCIGSDMQFSDAMPAFSPRGQTDSNESLLSTNRQ